MEKRGIKCRDCIVTIRVLERALKFSSQTSYQRRFATVLVVSSATWGWENAKQLGNRHNTHSWAAYTLFPSVIQASCFTDAEQHSTPIQ